MDERAARRIEATVETLAASLAQHLDALATWLEVPERLWRTRPRPDAWSVAEVVEHVALMQRFVLLLVDKIGARAQRRRAAGAPLPDTLDDLASLDELADQGRRWPHPEHMAPSGTAGRPALAAELAQQRRRCLGWLERLPRGEGALHSIRMSVVGRKLDLYGYLRLVDLHLARHLQQLERTRDQLSSRAPDAPAGPGRPAR